ncbi:MAG: hypothetical protein JNK68_01365 [Betaproteobacteria bacterium]|nr:hypothetical protein [Betaproteobacteria bacterium]
MTLTRRAALGLLAAGALATLTPRLAPAASLPPALRFRILRDGRQIGTHAVRFEVAGNGMRVSTAIDIEVKIAFIPAFRFSHRGTERWEDDRLVELKGTTNENGERFEVSGQLVGTKLQIAAPNGTTLADPTAFTTNDLWNRDAVQAKNLVDAHHGGLVGIVSRAEDDEDIAADGQELAASRYRVITPFLAGTIWYDGTGRWRKSDFEIKGERVEYRPA